jgi:hypothetical protein
MDQRVSRFRAPTSWRPVLRIAVVVLWVAWAVLSWWSQPRPADADQARADIAAGRVVAFEWGVAFEPSLSWDWARTPELRTSKTIGPTLAWRTPDQRIHYVRLDGPGSPADGTDRSTGDYTTGEAASMGAVLAAAGLDSDTPGISNPRPLMLATSFLWLTFLFVLVIGPAPVVGTRWFWFWAAAVAPFGSGILLWLARERPWSASASASAEPAREPRQRWYVGLGFGLLASLLATALVYGLNVALGDTVIPNP